MAEKPIDRKVRQDEIRLTKDKITQDRQHLAEVRAGAKATSSSSKNVGHGIFGLDILGL